MSSSSLSLWFAMVFLEFISRSQMSSSSSSQSYLSLSLSSSSTVFLNLFFPTAFSNYCISPILYFTNSVFLQYCISPILYFSNSVFLQYCISQKLCFSIFIFISLSSCISCDLQWSFWNLFHNVTDVASLNKPHANNHHKIYSNLLLFSFFCCRNRIFLGRHIASVLLANMM